MPVEIKFCGLTRASDAALGAALGASYLGVIFAASPRQVDAVRAETVFGSLPRGPGRPKKVGVFGPTARAEIARMAERLSLDVVQMHGDPRASEVESLRGDFTGEIWATRRISQDRLPSDFEEIGSVADGVLLDTRPPNGGPLGGAGVPFDWGAVAAAFEGTKGKTRIIVAGGLNAQNVGRAIAILAPSVVDVSSGVESAPGIKDPALMTDFVRAVGAAAE